MHILVDQDSVIADWDFEYDRRLDLAGSRGRRLPRTHQRTVFNLHDRLGPRQSALVRAIMDEPGFYRHLPVVPGAAEALSDMLDMGHEVTIVTSPWFTNPTCMQDKYEWLEEYIGPGWGERVVWTKDKTTVHGDILIDDKPLVVGRFIPYWTHILFDAPYNRDINAARIDGWTDEHNWRDIIAWVEESLVSEGASALARMLSQTTS